MNRNAMARWCAATAVLLLSLGIVSASVGAAFQTGEGENITVSKTETVQGDFYASGGTTIVDGAVTGDLVVAGRTVIVNGRVDGSILAAAETVTINGPVGGNVRAVGRQITIGSSVGKNATIAAESAFIGPSAVIGGDLISGSGNLETRGKIVESLRAASDKVTIGGQVGGDVSVGGSRVQVLPGLEVKGKFSYYSPAEMRIPDSARLSGGIDYHPTPERVRVDWRRAGRAIHAGWLAGVLGLGLLLWLLYPQRLASITVPERATWTRGLLLGLAGLVGGPLAIVICMASVILIPVALAILAVYLVGMMLTLPLAGGLVAQEFLHRYYPDRQIHPALLALAGMAAVLLLQLVPVLGPLVGLISFVLGYGLFVQFLSPVARPRSAADPAPETPAAS